jgi:hypothetical protein
VDTHGDAAPAKPGDRRQCAGHMSLIDGRVGVVDVADDLAGIRRLKRLDARSMSTANGGFRHYEGDDTETHTPEGELATTQVHRFPRTKP